MKEKEALFLNEIGVLEDSMQHDIAHKVAEIVEENISLGNLGSNPTIYQVSKLSVITALKLLMKE